jgi:hypothetical protein
MDGAPERFELPTYSSGGIIAPKNQSLSGTAQVCASLYLCGHFKHPARRKINKIDASMIADCLRGS